MSGVSWSWVGKGIRDEDGNRINYKSVVRHQGENEKRTFHVGDAVVVRNANDETWYAHLIALYDDHGALIPGSKASPARMRCDLRWFYDPAELEMEGGKHTLYFSDHIDVQMNSVYTIHGIAWLFQTADEAHEFRTNPGVNYMKQADKIRVVERYYDISHHSPTSTRMLKPGELKVLLANPSPRRNFAYTRRIPSRAASKSAPFYGRQQSENATSSFRSRKHPHSSSPEKVEKKSTLPSLALANKAELIKQIGDKKESLSKSVDAMQDGSEASAYGTPQNESSEESKLPQSLPRRRRRRSEPLEANAVESTDSESAYERSVGRNARSLRRRVVAESEDDSVTLSDTMNEDDGTDKLKNNSIVALQAPSVEHNMIDEDEATPLRMRDKTREEQPPPTKRPRYMHTDTDSLGLHQKKRTEEVKIKTQKIGEMPRHSPDDLASTSICILRSEDQSKLGEDTCQDSNTIPTHGQDLSSTTDHPEHDDGYDADGEVIQQRYVKSGTPESLGLRNTAPLPLSYAVVKPNIVSVKDDTKSVFIPHHVLGDQSDSISEPEAMSSPRRVTEASVLQTDTPFSDGSNTKKLPVKSETVAITNVSDIMEHSDIGNDENYGSENGEGVHMDHKAEAMVVDNDGWDNNFLKVLDDMRAALTRAPVQTQQVVVNNLEAFFDAAVGDVLMWCESHNESSAPSTDSIPDDVAEHIARRALGTINLLPATSS